MNWHLDWTHIVSALALLVITWVSRKLLALVKAGIAEIKALASVEDVKKAIHEANETQLDKIRKEGLLNGVYVRNDALHQQLVENVRLLIKAKERRSRSNSDSSKSSSVRIG